MPTKNQIKQRQFQLFEAEARYRQSEAAHRLDMQLARHELITTQSRQYIVLNGEDAGYQALTPFPVLGGAGGYHWSHPRSRSINFPERVPDHPAREQIQYREAYIRGYWTHQVMYENGTIVYWMKSQELYRTFPQENIIPVKILCTKHYLGSLAVSDEIGEVCVGTTINRHDLNSFALSVYRELIPGEDQKRDPFADRHLRVYQPDDRIMVIEMPLLKIYLSSDRLIVYQFEIDNPGLFKFSTDLYYSSDSDPGGSDEEFVKNNSLRVIDHLKINHPASEVVPLLPPAITEGAAHSNSLAWDIHTARYLLLNEAARTCNIVILSLQTSKPRFVEFFGISQPEAELAYSLFNETLNSHCRRENRIGLIALGSEAVLINKRIGPPPHPLHATVSIDGLGNLSGTWEKIVEEVRFLPHLVFEGDGHDENDFSRHSCVLHKMICIELGVELLFEIVDDETDKYRLVSISSEWLLSGMRGLFEQTEMPVRIRDIVSGYTIWNGTQEVVHAAGYAHRVDHASGRLNYLYDLNTNTKIHCTNNCVTKIQILDIPTNILDRYRSSSNDDHLATIAFLAPELPSL